MNLWRDLRNGIFNENPVFRLVLGMCPTLAVSLAVINGIGMGLAATAVLISSNIIISILRNVIPKEVRIPCFIVVIAAFVTIVDKMMAAFTPDLHRVLGIFIPLIVVNCIILARAEAFASKRPIINSLMDGLGMGLGFTLALAILAAIRELIGTGTIFVARDFGFAGFKLFHEDFGAKLMILPPGAFITLGLVLGGINWLVSRREAKRS